MIRFPKKIFTLAILLSSTSAFAAGEAMNEAINNPVIWAFGVAIGMLLLTLWALNKALNTIKWMSARDKAEAEQEVEVKQESAILQVLTDSVPIENEQDILLDHNYDGIMELDNNLPPWWKYGFYLTIIWGIGYLFVYHVFGTYPLQAEEFQNEMAE